MDKAIKRHILKKRILLAKRSDEPMTFTERAPKFFKWFEEDVMGFDSEEYRKEFWREAYKHGRTIGHVPHTLNDHLQSRGRRSEAAIIEALCIALLMGGAFAIWVMRRKIDQHLHHLRRPSYYETERARRLGLTEQRRRIRQRTTINARPDAGQLREAFIHARDSVGNMIRLGSLMEDLECYIDNSLIFGEDGKIVASEKKTVTLPPDSSVAVGDFRSLTVNHCSQATFLVLTLKTPHGEYQNDWHFGFYKDMPLANANIDITAGRVVPDALRRHEDMHPCQITLSTDKPAFFVWANVYGVRGEFDDNSFTLLPGRPKTLRFMPKQSMTPDEFRKALSVTNLE